MGGPEVVTLDGASLTTSQLERVARDPAVRVAMTDEARQRVLVARQLIERIVARYEQGRATGNQSAPSVYGVTTGFGEFKDVSISPDDLLRLQSNILLSHLVGVGESSDAEDMANYFPPDVVRAAILLRVNTFLKGNSGVRIELVLCLLAMLNRGVIPLVPTRGSVGSSGDLCPLSHLFSALVGHGRFYQVIDRREMSPGAKRTLRPWGDFWDAIGVSAIAPSYKEGLALTNGATFSAAMLALSVCDAQRLADTADLAAALSLEAMCGHTRAFDEKVHAARNLPGQQASARNLRRFVAGSKLIERSAQVQDAYSLRCAPQVHGASRDAVSYAQMVATAEINAATDNPLFFPESMRDPFDLGFKGNWPDGARDVHAYSAGNFHGQPVALAADFLAIAVAELASIAERRIQCLLDRHHNRNLPPNLTPNPGLNSGFMLVQYTAAGLVSENKVLAHPASVDSIPTSANSEDHNSMATIAARKLRTVVAQTQTVLALELLAATQAVEWRAFNEVDPNVGSGPTHSPSRFAEAMPQDRRDVTAANLGIGTAAAYRVVRDRIHSVIEDRPFDSDVRTARVMIEDGTLLDAVELAMGVPSAGSGG